MSGSCEKWIGFESRTWSGNSHAISSHARTKCAHCWRRIRFIRFDRRMNTTSTSGLQRLRGGNFLESVLPNPPVQLCARQSKSPCCLRLVAAAIAHDFDNRAAFDDAQIRRVAAK